MTNQDSDGLFENEWDDRSELSWSERDWEAYLAEQDRVVREYQGLYDQLPASPNRIDQVARQLGWECSENTDADEDDESDFDENLGDRWEPYTLHRNPVFVATKAIFLSLISRWNELVAEGILTGARPAVALHGSLHRGQEIVFHGIHALEMGDYTLAVCFFKRALRELNVTMALIGGSDSERLPGGFEAFARPRLFDLREILLRVMNECRGEDSADDDGS